MHPTDGTQPYRSLTTPDATPSGGVNLPSGTFLWAAMVAVSVALALALSGKTPESLFVGLWAAPYLLLGVCNRLVKVAGSDRSSVDRRNRDTSLPDRRRLERRHGARRQLHSAR